MAKFRIGEKLKEIVGRVAPAIGVAIGGPFGGIAGKFVQEALGVDSEQAAIDMLESDPESLLKLRTANQAFEAKMAELGIAEEQLHAEDRASARNLAIATNYWPQVALSILFVTGYFVILGLFFSARLIVPMNEAFMIMLGVLTAGVPQVMGFWLGSSSGSMRKTAMIGK